MRQLGLPWRGDHCPLPNNKADSLHRLQSLTRKFERQQLTTTYQEIIDDQKETGIIEAATSLQLELSITSPTNLW